MAIKPSDCQQRNPKAGYMWFFWFGDHQISEISKQNVTDFLSNFAEMFAKVSRKKQREAVHEALKVLAIETNYHSSNFDELITWAQNYFNGKKIHFTDVPEIVVNCLKKNKEILPTCSTTPDSLKKVQCGSLNIDNVCLACYKEETVVVHPLFKGGLCSMCKEILMESLFAIGEDGKCIYCVLCGHPGELLICDRSECQCSYCLSCVASLFNENIYQKILDTTPWFCFFCMELDICQVLQKRKDWEEKLLLLYQPDERWENSIPIRTIKKPIRVLSLFDGISTGKLALDKLGIEIDKYFSSEIDESALAVSKLHHSNSIEYIGDVTSLSERQIAAMCPIDLVIGGSPCNDLSLVNPLRKGLYDITGSGQLFFDFFHVLQMVKRNNKEHPPFFLYENVVTMSQSNKRIISSFLMAEPALIDAKYFSAQNRARYFWGNIPGMHGHTRVYYKEENYLSQCVLSNLGRKAMVPKIRTVTTQRNSLLQKGSMPVDMNGIPDLLWATELEKVFGFPVHYTDTGHLSLSRRQELLGRSWSLPVIVQIFSPLINFFSKNL